MLVRYQSVTGITDERIENAYTLLYRQLRKIRKLARNRKSNIHLEVMIQVYFSVVEHKKQSSNR